MKEYVNEADDFDYEDYVFNPKEIIENGKSIIDYTGVENNKVYLVNKTDILTNPRPSWIPEFDPEGLKADDFMPVTVHDSEGNYYVQSKIKTGEHEKTLNNYHQTKIKIPEFTTRIYKMNLDVLSATIDYYLKRERALLKEQGINKTVTLPRALKSMSIERYNDMVNLLSFCSNYRELESSANILKKYPRRSSSEGAKLQNRIIFTEQYQPFLSELKDKKLDLNYQKIDYANSRQKGEETSYGESNTINDLLDQYGVRIKKQNGTNFKEEEIKRFEEAINKVNDYYGNLKELSQKYDLILSYADNCHQYARSAIGLFSPYHQAIGVSFFDTDKMNERGASGDTILSHEVAHWLDNQKGQKSADWYASNKSGTLENKIALAYKAELRKHINSLNEKSSITNESKTVKLGDYWYRTCECLARSVEQDYAIKHGIKIDEKGYLPEDLYKEKIQPMVQELLEENRKHFNFETLKTNKSKSINLKENKLMNKLENNPATYFVKDTAEFDMFARFEPITGLTAEEAVAKLIEMKNKDYDCGIGINIPGDVVFDDPEGFGAIIFESMPEIHKFSFYIGDTFVKELKVKNEHSENVIKAFKGLDSAIRNSGIYKDGLYDEPAFLFEKEKELGFVNEQFFTNEEEVTLTSLGFKKHEFHIENENIQVIGGNNDEWFEKANGNTVVKIWIEPEQGTNGRTFNWSNTIEKEGFNNLLWERGENEMDYPSLMGCLLSITKRSISSSERPFDDVIITPKELVPFLNDTDKDFYLKPGNDIKDEPFVKAMQEAIRLSEKTVLEVPVPKSAKNKLSGRTKVWFAGSDKTVQNMLDYLGENNMADFSLEQKEDKQLYIQGYDNGGKLRGKMNVSEEEIEYLYSKLNSPEAKVHLNERFNQLTGKSFQVENKANDIINNFILDKLEKAGIEVVTDKEEYNRILEAHSQNISQKLIMDWVSEKEIDYQTINKPDEILPLLNNYNKTPQELFMAISLDGSHKPISCRIVSAGTVNLSLVHPREVFREAIKDNAAALIVAHNHPSGNVQPSDQDIKTTKTLLEASKIIGIPILDHIITSPNQKDYYSFNEHGLIQSMKENGVTYGFVYENKIYLDPDLLNSRVAIHEYTHLWDNYTMRTNSELWDKGLQLFKNTKYWNEIISEPNYQDIKDDDNLVLSEIHSRICGEMAEKVFNRIAELDGEQVKLDAIDWNTETWNYIFNELELDLEHSYDEHGRHSYSDLADFLSTPMKDFMNKKQITRKEEYTINLKSLFNELYAYREPTFTDNNGNACLATERGLIRYTVQDVMNGEEYTGKATEYFDFYDNKSDSLLCCDGEKAELIETKTDSDGKKWYFFRSKDNDTDDTFCLSEKEFEYATTPVSITNDVIFEINDIGYENNYWYNKQFSETYNQIKEDPSLINGIKEDFNSSINELSYLGRMTLLASLHAVQAIELEQQVKNDIPRFLEVYGQKYTELYDDDTDKSYFVESEGSALFSKFFDESRSFKDFVRYAVSQRTFKDPFTSDRECAAVLIAIKELGLARTLNINEASIPDMNMSDISVLMVQRKKGIEALSEIEKELNENPSNTVASSNKVTVTNSLNEINSEIKQEVIKNLKARGLSDLVLEYTDEKSDTYTQSFRIIMNEKLMGSVSVASDGFIGGKDNQGNHFNLEQPETTKMFKEYLEREIGKGAYKDLAPEPDKSFRYYLTQRPVSIGTQPDGFINQESFEEKKYDNYAGRAVYGYVEYDHELSEKEIKDFELSKPNPFREVIIEPSSDNKLDYPYVLYGRIGDMKGTPLSNYKARISNANLEIKFNGFKSFEEAIALVKNNFKPLEQNISNAINDVVHELTGEIDKAFKDTKKQIDEEKKIEDEITEDLKVEIANRLEGVPLENQPVITRVKVYKPEDYGFEADGKLHVLAEYETDTGFREDSLFNLLHNEDEPLFYNGNIIDVNPITPEKSGTIESYLENLKSMHEKRNVSVENEPLEKARIVADYIIQLGMERSSDLENCHVSFEDIPLDVADQKWVKEHYEDINYALAEHNDNELLDYFGDENEENEFNLYFCSNAEEDGLNTLFRVNDSGRWVRKPDNELEIEEKMNAPEETNEFTVLRSDSEIVKLWDEHPEQVRKGIYLIKENDTFITIDNSSGDCWTEEFDSLYKAFIYINFAEGAEQIQELSEETAKNICMDYEITKGYFKNLEQKIEEINNLSLEENEKLFRTENHIAGTMLENGEMSENGQFILNETSNGMLSKYIDKSEVSTIDEFRNYAAVRITGNLQDRTPGNDYFSQLYNLGIKFCIERGYQLPVFPQEVYDKALEDYKIKYSENETFSMNGYSSDADEFYKALPEMNILQVQALLSGSKEFFQTNNELLINNIYPHITVKKDGKISIDLQVAVTDKDPDNPVRIWRINDSISEKNRSYLIQKFTESIREKEFRGEKVPDWVTNILNKKENTIANEVSENKNVSNSTNVLQKQAKPFDIIYNEEKGRVNIRLNPAKQNPYFNEIIKELKNENWHFAKSTRSWYPIKVDGSSEFAEKIFEKYQNFLASEKEQVTSISPESVTKTATIQEDNNNPYSGLKFFDRNYEEGKDFLVYLNKNLKEGERPLSLSESQIILNALNHEDIGLLNQRSHRLALDENNVLTIVEKHESEVIKIKTNLNELLKTAKEMAEFSVAEFEQKLKSTEQNIKDIPGFDFNVHFKSMYENCLVDSKKVSENMHDIFESYYNKFQEISSDDFLSVQAAKKAKLIENGEPYVEITFSESSDGKRLEKGTVWTLNEAEVLFPKKNEEFKGAYLKVDYTVNLFDKEGEEVSYSGTMDLGTDHPLEPFSDYLRMMCSYDEVLNAYETSWEKMNTPSLSSFQKRRVENILYPHMEHLTERFSKLKDELSYVLDAHKTLIQPVIMDAHTFESSEKEVDKVHGKIKNLFEREINSSLNDLYEYLEEQNSPELEKYAEHKLKNILQNVQYSESRKQNMDFDYGFWRESLKNVPAAADYDSIIKKNKKDLLKEIEEIKETRRQNGTSKLPVAKFTNFNYFPSRFVEYMKTGNPQGLSDEDKLMADSFIRENKLKFGCIEVIEEGKENCSHPDLGEPCETVRVSFKTTEYFMMPELKNGDALDSDVVSNVIKLGEGVYQANLGEEKGNHFIVDQQIGNNLSTKIRNLFFSKGNRLIVDNKLFDPYVALELIEKNIIPPRDDEYLQNLRSYIKENPLACTIFKTSFRQGITEENIGSVNLIDKWFDTINNFAENTFKNLSRNDQEEVKKWFGKLEISKFNPPRKTKLTLSTLLPEKLGDKYRKLNNLSLSKTKNNGYPPRGE